MARKKGSKNADTDFKSAVIASKVLNEGKTRQMVADELGINRSTVTKHLERALSNDQIGALVEKSRQRVAEMLSLADHAYKRILTYNHPDNFSNQARVAQSIYRTFGVIRDQPIINANFTPITIRVENEVHSIALGSTSETGSRIQE